MNTSRQSRVDQHTSDRDQTDASVALVDQFREAMATVPSPVAVVTTRAGDQSHGTTVSAFLSLSLDPPTVLVSLANTSMLLAKLDLGSQAGLSVLAADQAAIGAPPLAARRTFETLQLTSPSPSPSSSRSATIRLSSALSTQPTHRQRHH